ncbi:SDR family oxidoreductase [Olivibacter sp. XZL3]|uniref:SDR family NAD(P)-dependent oxidoreductase n=1 Tax=Olivibacter sp. XZL3 TaxID=1735116 RepID=UPI001064C243|nr:SDR family NAD(P)-dependent oxidoreductase [Olivibacter sp. XZL3]
MRNLDFKGKWVLVTGASSGLGEEMARQLAVQHGANLILLARRKERLEQLKHTIERETKSCVDIVVADLSEPEQVEEILETIISRRDLYAAVLNAGVTYLGKHLALSKEQFNQMIQVNIISVTYMTSQLAAYFEKKKSVGGIMIVSSMAAIFPTPFQAAYAGTKGFLLNFAAALSQELENKELSLTIFLPGGIATEMTSGDGFKELRGYLMPVQQVAKEGLTAFRKRRATYIPGFLNRLSSKLSFLLRKEFIIKQTGKTYKKSLDKLSGL